MNHSDLYDLIKLFSSGFVLVAMATLLTILLISN